MSVYLAHIHILHYWHSPSVFLNGKKTRGREVLEKYLVAVVSLSTESVNQNFCIMGQDLSIKQSTPYFVILLLCVYVLQVPLE